MPAVTVENPLTLPRLPQPLNAVHERQVLAITTAPSGFEERASLSARHLRRSSPSISTRSS